MTPRAKAPNRIVAALFRSPSVSMLAATALALSAPVASAQTQILVAKFHRDMPGAFAFTFDDALPTQLIYAAPYLKQVGLKGSFYLITGNILDSADGGPAINGPTTWAEWKAVAEDGNEIGSHTVTHRDLTKLTADEVSQELTVSAKAIKDKLGITPVTLAYPYNLWNPGITKLRAKTYIAARESQVGYGTEAGFANTAETMNKYADDAVNGKLLRIGMIHGLTEPYSPTDTAQFLAHLKYCRQLMDEGKLWVAAFGEISKYRIEKDSVHIKIESEAAGRVSFTAQTSLDSAIFTVPLTFVLANAGSGPLGVKAVRDGASIPPDVVVRKDGSIQVLAAPGPGLITVTWTPSSAVFRDGKVKAAGPGKRIASNPLRKYLVSGRRYRGCCRP
jgi:peptidoglycan/xylan/chitin deacetylase (PgdA/CDA1 family)